MNAIKRILGNILYYSVEPFAKRFENFRVHKAVERVDFKVRNYQIKGPVSVVGPENIHIGKNFSAGIHFRIDAISEYAGDSFIPCIKIGDNVSIQDFCHIGCVEKITIGDGTMIASKVLIIDHNHGLVSSFELGTMPLSRSLSHEEVSIGRNVWIGDCVSIMPGVSLGNGVIVGANSVVTKSFGDNAVIAGCPAKLIKQL